MNFAAHLVLENSRVRLRPLEVADFDALKSIALHPDIWRHTATPNPGDAVGLAAYLQTALRERAEGRRYPFAVLCRHTGRLAGCTSYGNVVPEQQRLEIGWSWLAPEFQRTGVNRAAKHLLLKYAFGELGYERVELRTAAHNWPSRRAIRALGATEEGVLRSHGNQPGGGRRDTVCFSILKPEWDELRRTVFGEYDARG